MNVASSHISPYSLYFKLALLEQQYVIRLIFQAILLCTENSPLSQIVDKQSHVVVPLTEGSKHCQMEQTTEFPRVHCITYQDGLIYPLIVCFCLHK